MNIFKIFIGDIMIISSLFAVIDIVPVWGKESSAGKITFIILILFFLIIGTFLLKKGIKKEYKGEKKNKMKLMVFIKKYFIKYSDFLDKYIDKKLPPLFILIIGFLGAYNIAYLAESNNYLYGGYITNWGTIWLMWIFLSIPLGYISYVLLGSIYHILIRIAGGKGEWNTSRNIFLYAGIPVYILSVLIKIIETFIYGSKYFVESSNANLDILFLIIIFIASLYSIFLAYKGAIKIQKTKRIRSIILFIVIPFVYLFFIYANAVTVDLNKTDPINKLNDRAIFYINQGDFDRAEESLKMVIDDLVYNENKKDFITANINLAVLYLKKGETDLALNTYKDILKVMSEEDGAEYHSVKGVVSTLMADIPSAISDFEKALEIDNYNKTANNYMGLIYLGGLGIEYKDINKALIYNERSYELNKIDSGIIQNLAVNYYELEKYSEAISLFNLLVKISPNHPLFQYMTGMSYYKSGDLSNAKTHLGIAVSLNPNLLTEEIQKILNEVLSD